METNHAEVISCHQGYLSYIGTNRNAEYGRMQPYLYNLDKQLAYQYDDSVLYLSQAGILWVEYLKPEDEIGVGTIFNAENSRMRFLAFKEMRENNEREKNSYSSSSAEFSRRSRHSRHLKPIFSTS
ncbi:hypothetical protein HO566_03145 [Streptococcus suis]|nr:hypothetical protein [Streptococcus suis]